MLLPPARRGTLIRTATLDETRQWAARNGATVIGSLDELGSERAVCFDLDAVDTATAASIGSHFRARGVELTVAARPGSDVPFAVRRNLAHGD